MKQFSLATFLVLFGLTSVTEVLGNTAVYMVGGCTSPFACNYDPAATEDDGSCEYNTCQWCNDPTACNFGDGFPWTANPNLCVYIQPDECDCEGNVLDAIGVCGGDCAQDSDGDGICDDVDTCIGVEDECGICGGPGAILECGCEVLLAGDCDCEGNQLDAVGV